MKNLIISVKLMLMGISFLILSIPLMNIDFSLSMASIIFGLGFSIYGLFTGHENQNPKVNLEEQSENEKDI